MLSGAYTHSVWNNRIYVKMMHLLRKYTMILLMNIQNRKWLFRTYCLIGNALALCYITCETLEEDHCKYVCII